MKNIKKIALLFVFVASCFFVSCVADSDTLTGDAGLGGVLKLKKEAINYYLGQADGANIAYNNNISIYQGNEKVVKIDVYKTFSSPKLGTDGMILKDMNGKDSIVYESSNKFLYKTFVVPAAKQHEVVDYSVSYNELIKDLIFRGAPVNSDDSKLKIGDYFTLTYVSTLNNGKVFENFSKTKVSISTRFAGTYKVIKSVYWRIGVLRTDISWKGEKRIIESVDATTYRFLKFAGPFGPPSSQDNTHYFTVGTDFAVRTPKTYNGVALNLNGQPIINCESDSSNMTNTCGVYPGFQNIAVKDDVEGKDRIYRTYGYLSPSGSREIYEVLEKIVD